MLINGDTELSEEAVNVHLKAHGADQPVASAIGAGDPAGRCRTAPPMS
jgi:hypothetical protein